MRPTFKTNLSLPTLRTLPTLRARLAQPRALLPALRPRPALLLALLPALFSISCSPASKIPGGGANPDSPSRGDRDEITVSIAFLKTLYTGAPTLVTGEYLITGNVVSNDHWGNFHKTMVLDDGTGGIEVKLDMEEIFKTFWYHTRATVRLNGLWIGSSGGTLQLGARPHSGYETQYISESQIAERITCDRTFYGEVMSQRLTFSQLDARHISTFVRFDGVQFTVEELGLPWADTSYDTSNDPSAAAPAYTRRRLVDPQGLILEVSTSRHAKFANKTIPSGNGYIEGIVGYFNGRYRLTVCDFTHAEMTGPRF